MYEKAFRQGPTRSLMVSPGSPFKILDVSDAYLDVTLTTRDIVGRPMFDVFPDNPNDPAHSGVRDLTASFDRALLERTTDVMAVQKYDIRDRSGKFVERFWTPVNTTVVGDDGTRIMVVHRVEDVTAFVREGEMLRGEAAHLRHEILARARDLAAVNGALRDSVEHRRRIVAIVGHDLRNPLSAIRNGIEVLKAHFQKLGATLPQTLTTLQSASSRMEELLGDLNDYTVSQLRGALPVSREWVNLRDVCEDVVRATQLGRPDRTVELEPGENIAAYVDPTRKRQVLANLISNALDHGAGGPPGPGLAASGHRRMRDHRQQRGRAHPSRPAPVPVRALPTRPELRGCAEPHGAGPLHRAADRPRARRADRRGEHTAGNALHGVHTDRLTGATPGMRSIARAVARGLRATACRGPRGSPARPGRTRCCPCRRRCQPDGGNTPPPGFVKTGSTLDRARPGVPTEPSQRHPS